MSFIEMKQTVLDQRLLYKGSWHHAVQVCDFLRGTVIAASPEDGLFNTEDRRLWTPYRNKEAFVTDIGNHQFGNLRA